MRMGMGMGVRYLDLHRAWVPGSLTFYIALIASGIHECPTVQTVSEMSTCKPWLQHFFSFAVAAGTVAEIAYTFVMRKRANTGRQLWWWVAAAFNLVGAGVLVIIPYDENGDVHRAGAFVKFIGSFTMAGILYRAEKSAQRAFAYLALAGLAAVAVVTAAYYTPYADSESYAEFALIIAMHAALIEMYLEPKDQQPLGSAIEMRLRAEKSDKSNKSNKSDKPMLY